MIPMGVADHVLSTESFKRRDRVISILLVDLYYWLSPHSPPNHSIDVLFPNSSIIQNFRDPLFDTDLVAVVFESLDNGWIEVLPIFTDTEIKKDFLTRRML